MNGFGGGKGERGEKKVRRRCQEGNKYFQAEEMGRQQDHARLSWKMEDAKPDSEEDGQREVHAAGPIKLKGTRYHVRSSFMSP